MPGIDRREGSRGAALTAALLLLLLFGPRRRFSSTRAPGPRMRRVLSLICPDLPDARNLEPSPCLFLCISTWPYRRGKGSLSLSHACSDLAHRLSQICLCSTMGSHPNDADADASNPEVMKTFYNRLFPWKQLFTWLNHEHGPSSRAP
jgi:hypothetical protein